MSVEGPIAAEDVVSEAVSLEEPIKVSPEEKLKILLTEGGSKKEAFKLLGDFFGQDLTQRVVDTGISKHWPDQLGSQQCLILTATIGQRLTLEDLESCYKELRSGEKTRSILNYSKLSGTELWWAGAAKNLAPESLDHLIGLFRNPLQAIDPSFPNPLGERLLEGKLYRTRSVSYTFYDYVVGELAKQGDKTRPEFLMAPRELIARTIAYADPTMTEVGMLMRRFDENTGKFDYYQISEQLHESGLHAYLLTPLDSRKNLPAQLIFRGTDCEYSTHRDLDPTGVGKQVFDRCAPEIQAMVARYAAKVKNPKVEVIGHSLGGADAQRAMIVLVDPANPFHLSEVRLFAYCSPKLDHPTYYAWQNHLKTLATHSHKPEIHLNFAHHESDLITMTGDEILSGIDEYYVQCSYLVVKSPSGYTNTKLHHTYPFFNFGNFDFSVDERFFEFFQSVSEEELSACIRKLEDLQNSYQWYLSLKRYFVTVENPEDIQKRIEELRAKRERLHDHNHRHLNQSWLVWSAHNTVKYSLHLRPVIYPIFAWYNGIKSKKKG